MIELIQCCNSHSGLGTFKWRDESWFSDSHLCTSYTPLNIHTTNQTHEYNITMAQAINRRLTVTIIKMLIGDMEIV